MHRYTRQGCELAITKAIQLVRLSNLPNDKKTTEIQYLERRVASPYARQWALYARQHSPLLLQITSTNPLESYHSRLKAKVHKQFALSGAAKVIIEIDKAYEDEAYQACIQFRSKNITEIKEFPELKLFPYPIQLLMREELFK
ncbi:hypothetical protein HDV00_001257, partial [Rhizophlyctis rosea]